MTDALLRLFRDLRPQLAGRSVPDVESADLLALVLMEAVHSGSLRDFYESLLPRNGQYEALRGALIKEQEAESLPALPEIGRGDTLRVGDAGARVRAVRARILGSSIAAPNSDDEFDTTLETAVKEYQQLHGLEADGMVGRRTQRHLDMSAHERAARIRLALARWRELPVTLGNEYVQVNIPEYRLELIRDGEQQLEMRVVVGSRDNPTPEISDEIEYLVFNPYWNVPRRIALEELVPKAAETPGYLTSQQYEILEQDSLVEESMVDWGNVSDANFGYRIRQRPGPGNALGNVKFLFPNAQNIYLHDSPARSLYQRATRAFSHGCIRLEDPRAFAAALLERQGDWSSERVDDAMSAGRRRQVNLEHSVPVYLTYITARVTASGALALFEDVYGRDRAAIKRYL